MKIIILFFLFVVGCNKQNKLDELESRLYELDEVYVLMDQDELDEMFEIGENDYKDILMMKTLVIYEQKERKGTGEKLQLAKDFVGASQYEASAWCESVGMTCNFETVPNLILRTTSSTRPT